jgi:hypothetical protein
MKLLRTSFLTAIGLALLAGALSLTYQRGVEAQAGAAPVRVVNTAIAPALARDVDHREPYAATRQVTSPGGDSLFTLFPTVPNGKRLVIQHITLRAAVPAGQGVEGYIHHLGFAGLHDLPIRFQYSDSAGNDVFVGSEDLLAFGRAGDEPRIVVTRNSTTGSWDLRASVTGFLVDQ